MDITEKELFEILGRKDAQIYALTKQIKQHQEYAHKLQKEIEATKPEKKKPK